MKRIFFAKIENKTVFALFCFFGAIFVLFSACGALPEGAYFPQDPFWVEAEGEIDGEQISVKVFCDPTDHMTKELLISLHGIYKTGRVSPSLRKKSARQKRTLMKCPNKKMSR